MLRVSAYRGGHLPNERRRGEQAMRAGQVDLVVATSALETALPDRQQAIEGFLGADYALHHVEALLAMIERKTALRGLRLLTSTERPS